MTADEAFKTLTENICQQCAYGARCMHECDIRGCDNRDAVERLMLYCNKKKTEKTGKWIDHKDEHQCSICGEVVIAEVHDGEWGSQGIYEYCPYCGAKMEE